MDAQAGTQELAERFVASGQEVGLQVAAYLNGEPVVNVCAGTADAGTADAATGRPVDERTLFPSGPGPISTVVHVLAEQGLLDYGTPVAAYWPEFGAHGKTDVTLAHVLTHSAGVPQTPSGITLDDLADWDGMCTRIADLRPLWRAGATSGHHGLTYGFILGEVARRVTGRPVSAVLRDEVAAPLGVPDDLFFGVPARHLYRVARLEDGDRSDSLVDFPDGSLYHQVFPSWMQVGAALTNRPEWRVLDLPSGGLAFADPQRRFSFAYLPSLLTPGLAERAYQVADGIRLALGLETAMIQAVRRRIGEHVVRRGRARVA